MDSVINNVFKIADAETYSCVIRGYTSGHSQMFMQLYQSPPESKNAFYLIFETVLYFEGPMSWHKADFRTGTYRECSEVMDLLRRGGLTIPDQMVDAYLNKYQLFVLEDPNLRVRIFAERVYRTTSTPRILYEPSETPAEIVDITPPPRAAQ